MDGKRGQANGRVVNEPSRTEAGMTGHDESLGADLSGRPSVCFLFVFFWGARATHFLAFVFGRRQSIRFSLLLGVRHVLGRWFTLQFLELIGFFKTFFFYGPLLCGTYHFQFMTSSCTRSRKCLVLQLIGPFSSLTILMKKFSVTSRFY